MQQAKCAHTVLFFKSKDSLAEDIDLILECDLKPVDKEAKKLLG